MVAVTVGLIVNNIQIILHGGRHVNFSAVAYFELAATVISFIVILLLRRMNADLTSPIVTMEIQEWKIDAVASLGMSAAFFLPLIIQAEWFVPLTKYLDQAIAIILSIFMLPVPVRAVTTGLRDLFLLPPEEETVQNIKDIITPILDAYGYDKLYFDIVRTGRKLWILLLTAMRSPSPGSASCRNSSYRPSPKSTRIFISNCFLTLNTMTRRKSKEMTES